MANKLIGMNKIKQIIRLYTHSKGTKFISVQTGIARNTVKKYIRIFRETHLTYDELNMIPEQDLIQIFGKPPLVLELSNREKDLLSFYPYMDKALRRTGMTREKIWKEYLTKHPDGYK